VLFLIVKLRGGRLELPYRIARERAAHTRVIQKHTGRQCVSFRSEGAVLVVTKPGLGRTAVWQNSWHNAAKALGLTAKHDQVDDGLLTPPVRKPDQRSIQVPEVDGGGWWSSANHQ
jgi:hypothetical protein